MLDAAAERLALLLGLSLFFGFAFEGFYSEQLPHRPGGVRSFPLLALAGGGLYLLEPRYAAAFIAGLLVVGGWLYAFVCHELETEQPEGMYMVPVCNLLAYALGPIALTQPLWVGVTLAVAAVLLLGGRHTLHDWARRVSATEVMTATQFLILVGVVLPLLAGKPAIPYTSITPFGVWLAVVAVSSISYASYLLQRYVFPGRGTFLMSILGGLYSSTATTVVLSRRAHDEGMTPELQGGIVVATAMMYLRILLVCFLFNVSLGRMLVAPLVGLAIVSAVVAVLCARLGTRSQLESEPVNPLQIWTALIFAVLFIVISMLTAFVKSHLGNSGVYGLAAIVGVTDIDPFVLSLAQSGANGVGLATAAIAIVIATSSNNVLKAVYTVAFSRRRESWLPAAILAAIALLGLAAAALLAR